MSTTQKVKIQLRRGENYTGTLDVGEAFYNTSDKTLQIGDGKTALANLPKFTTTDKFPIEIVQVNPNEEYSVPISELKSIASKVNEGKYVVVKVADQLLAPCVLDGNTISITTGDYILIYN